MLQNGAPYNRDDKIFHLNLFARSFGGNFSIVFPLSYGIKFVSLLSRSTERK